MDKGTRYTRYTEETVTVAIQLGRLWGIAETLEDIPVRSPEKITQMLLEWSREYMESKDQKPDIVKFFLEKKEVYRNL